MSGFRRRIESNQIRMRKMFLRLDGTPATPICNISGAKQGPDNINVSSVVDNGVGDYTIIFKNPFRRSDIYLSGWSTFTPNVVECVVTAIAKDRITINLFDAAGAAIEGDVFLEVLGCDGKNYAGKIS
jgi:hypothetical protein